MIDQCANCRFYDAAQPSCRESPPVVVAVSRFSCVSVDFRLCPETVWPTVQMDDWCGRWQLDKDRFVRLGDGSIEPATDHPQDMEKSE